MSKTYYIFIDESGEKYNTAKSDDCFMLHGLLTDTLAYEIIGDIFTCRMQNHANKYYEYKGKSLEKFHATEDEQAVRNQVFQIINKLSLQNNMVFSVIMEKRLSHVRNNDNFYIHQRNAVKYLLQGILHYLKAKLGKDDNLVICFDALPGSDTKDKKSMLAGIKKTIKEFLETMKYEGVYHIFDERSCANPYLQIIDYIGWAIYKRY
jgi:hypothetical protein